MDDIENIEKKVKVCKSTYFIFKFIITLSEVICFYGEYQIYTEGKNKCILIITISAIALLAFSWIFLMRNISKQVLLIMESMIFLLFILIYVSGCFYVDYNCSVSINDKNFDLKDNKSSNQEINTYIIEESTTTATILTIYEDLTDKSTIAPIKTIYEDLMEGSTTPIKDIYEDLTEEFTIAPIKTISEDLTEESTTIPIKTINEDLTWSTIPPSEILYEGLTKESTIAPVETIYEDLINESLKMRKKLLELLFEFDNTSEQIIILTNEHYDATDEPTKDSFKKPIVNFKCDEFYGKIISYSCMILLFQLIICIVAFLYNRYTIQHNTIAQAVFHQTHGGEGDVNLGDEELLNELEGDPQVGTSQPLESSRTDPEAGTTRASFHQTRDGEGVLNLGFQADEDFLNELEDETYRRSANTRADSEVGTSQSITSSRTDTEAGTSRACMSRSPRINTVSRDEMRINKEVISEVSANVTPIQYEIPEVHNIGRFTIKKVKETSHFMTNTQSLPLKILENREM